MSFIAALIAYFFVYVMFYLMPVVLLVNLFPEAWRSFLAVPIKFAGLGAFFLVIWQTYTAASYYGNGERTFWQAHKAAEAERDLMLRFLFKGRITRSVPTTNPVLAKSVPDHRLQSIMLKNKIKSIIDKLLIDKSVTHFSDPALLEEVEKLPMQFISNAPYYEFLRMADLDLAHSMGDLGRKTTQHLIRLKTYFDGGEYTGFAVNDFGYEEVGYSQNAQSKIKQLVDIIKDIPDTDQQKYILSKRDQISIIKNTISNELKFDAFMDFLVGYALETMNGDNPDIAELKKTADYIVNKSSHFRVKLDGNGSLIKLTLLKNTTDNDNDYDYAKWEKIDITHVRETVKRTF